jgi:serine/threonine protein kinase
MRLKWPLVAKKRENIRNFDEHLTLPDVFRAQASHPSHQLLKDFLSFMLVLDPAKRPSAADCLAHPFITSKVHDETTRGRPSIADSRSTDGGSKSTEKTTSQLSAAAAAARDTKHILSSSFSMNTSSF